MCDFNRCIAYCKFNKIRDVTFVFHGTTTVLKGQAIPLQALTGPGVYSRLRLPDFKTIGTLRW
jgi:hypothetical protein